MNIVLFALGIVLLILIPLAPKLVRLRTRFFKWLHWNWAVNLLEKNFDGWVLFFRIVLFVIAAVLLSVGWEMRNDKICGIIQGGWTGSLAMLDEIVAARA